MASQYQYLNQTGVIVPDTSATLAEVQTEYQAVFGADLIITPDTPQGVLITAETIARNEVINNNAALANQINPNIAGGNFLDAIMALMGVQRTPASPSVVPNVALTGVAGTIIAAGTQARTSAGDVFESVSIVTLDGSGDAMVNFQSVIDGPIPCGANDLTIIVTNVLGWETVNNATAATVGASTQSDQAARAYRQNTLAYQGVALPVAITSALYAVDGVTSLSFLENYDSVPLGLLVGVVGGTTLAGTTWGLTTTGPITVGTTAMAFASSLQTAPGVNPWPTAAFSTTGNITLSGLGTQGGGDWPGSLTGGQIILVKNQTTGSQNGIYLANSSTWTRQAYNTTSSVIQGSNAGISMIANSIYTCVNGGTSGAIAAALLENKSSGCAWNGNNSVAVVEPVSNQTYTVLYDTPTAVPIIIQVTTPNGSVANIQQAILDYAAGNINGLAGFVVGADVSAFEIAGAIMSEYPNYYISLVQITPASPFAYGTGIIPIALDQIATITISNINVIIA